MDLEKETNVLKDFQTKDPCLLKDAINFSASNMVHLTRRLEAAAKSLAQIAPSLDSTADDVLDYVSQLVHCFLSVGETTKVSKGVERVLVAAGAKCQDIIKKELGENFLLVLHQLSENGRELKKVSTLLEHSKLVQAVMADYIPTALEQLGKLFSKLMSDIPGDLNREDGDRLYCTIKLCLQLFQLFPALRQQGWFHLQQLGRKETVRADAEQLKDSMAVIVNEIMGVLTAKCYPRDTTLLAGTAVSILLNAASAPEDSAQCFITVYSAVSGGVPFHQMKGLELDTGTRHIPVRNGNCTAEIALLRSIIIGSSQNLLCCAVEHCNSGTSESSQSQAFLLNLFPIVCNLCDAGTEFQYLSFHLLSLWVQKVLVCLPALSLQERNRNLMSKDSATIAETLKRIWVSWDSPVEGVAEYVAETFKTLLEVWHAEVENGRSDYVQLGEELMLKVVQMPWYSRSRYKPLSLLAPYVNTDKWLQEKERLKGELLKCMGATFLTALASDAYTAFVQAIRNSVSVEEQAGKWREIWLPSVVSGLTSPDSLIRNKVCVYWLPTTLKILPDTGPLLQRHLEDSLQAMGDNPQHVWCLFAWIAVCRNIRTYAELDLKTLPEQLLMEAVYSDDEDICAEALTLLSTTQKKAEPLGEVETSLFRAALPYCLKVDSAPFRQKLVSSLKKVFVRVRDSCSTAIKRRTQGHFIDPSVQFIDWLYRLVMMNMAPSTCFQRRRTCLDVVQGWLETIIFVETDGAKKGKAQGPADVLIKYAQAKGLWDFFSSYNRTVLLLCVKDGADEIQETAIHIVSKYFPWTPEGGSPAVTASSNQDLVVHLLQHGLELCNSPRAYENRSGSLLVRLVYQKFVRGQCHQFHVHEDRSRKQFSVQLSTTDSPSQPSRQETCAAFFKNVLFKRIELSLNTAKLDALFASKHDPTHGMLQALYECLCVEQADPGSMSSEDWQEMLTTVINLCTATVTLVLQMLAGGQTDNCPSFAEMGVALEQLLAGEGSAEQEVTSSISPEFQLLLSWCWLNLKESCTSLGMAVALTTKQKQEKGFLLTPEVTESVGSTFLKVLTHCRHRGAIEGCRNGFLQFCTSLMSCEDPFLSVIPANILNQVLSSLEKDEMTSSVTRRSAGLPIIIQTIAQAEKKCKSNKLLQQTVSRLYSIATQPPRSQSDQTQDQAPVHALNVLKAIFSDASLSGGLLSHLGNMMQLVIHSFESSSWAVRNAATQLVSTLVTRMFGQRNKASLSCNMMTLQEMSAHFPDLLVFVEQKLGESMNAGDSITDVQPSLFLVLTLLASLGPATDSSQCHRLASCLRNIVLDALSSPVYFLRELSATAVVALTPMDASDMCVRELLGRLVVTESTRHASSNSIHGTLICLDKLLTSRSVSGGAAEEILDFVLNNTRLLSPAVLCPLVCAKCVDVLNKAVFLLPSDCSQREKLLKSLMDALFSLQSGRLQVGESLFIRSATSLIYSLVKSAEAPIGMSMPDFVLRCLASHDAEQRSAVLNCILQNPEVLRSDDLSLLKILWHHLQEETDASCIINISKLLVDRHSKRHVLPSQDIDLCLRDIDVLKSRFAKLANVQAALFPVAAVVLSKVIKCASDTTAAERLSSSITEWSHQLLKSSQPYQNEDLRMAAAQAIFLAGEAAFSYFAKWPGKTIEPAVFSLCEACMLLLEETDSEIRQIVTQFVGSLQWSKKNPKVSHMNSNLCSKVFLSYLCDELGHCTTVHQMLFNKLFSPGDLSTCLQKVIQPRTQYLFEHEENTFFSEKIHQQWDIYQVLMPVTVTSDGATTLPVLLAELKTAVPVLQSSSSKKPVYNLFGEAGVRAALTGLVMQIKLLTSNTSSSQDLHQLHTQASQELEKLTQIGFNM